MAVLSLEMHSKLHWKDEIREWHWQQCCGFVNAGLRALCAQRGVMTSRWIAPLANHVMEIYWSTVCTIWRAGAVFCTVVPKLEPSARSKCVQELQNVPSFVMWRNGANIIDINLKSHCFSVKCGVPLILKSPGEQYFFVCTKLSKRTAKQVRNLNFN